MQASRFDKGRTSEWASELTRPPPLVALVLLLVNDHVLKGAGALPGWLTGKLSDFAGLFLFSVLLFVLTRSFPAWSRERSARVAALATAVGFALLKLSPTVNQAANLGFGRIVLDPTDLVALPTTLVAYCWLRRPSASSPAVRRVYRGLAVIAACTACLATAREPARPATYPEWRLHRLGAREIGCATLDAWVFKSEGNSVTITLHLLGSGSNCRLRIQSASLRIGDDSIAASRLPPELALSSQEQHADLHFPLAGGVRPSGELDLAVSATGTGIEHIELALSPDSEGRLQPIQQDASQPQRLQLPEGAGTLEASDADAGS